MIEITIRVDKPGLQAIEHLQARLGSPNITTALVNAVDLLEALYREQDDGYELRLVKSGDHQRRYRLPGV